RVQRTGDARPEGHRPADDAADARDLQYRRCEVAGAGGAGAVDDLPPHVDHGTGPDAAHRLAGGRCDGLAGDPRLDQPVAGQAEGQGPEPVDLTLRPCIPTTTRRRPSPMTYRALTGMLHPDGRVSLSDEDLPHHPVQVMVTLLEPDEATSLSQSGD